MEPVRECTCLDKVIQKYKTTQCNLYWGYFLIEVFVIEQLWSNGGKQKHFAVEMKTK